MNTLPSYNPYGAFGSTPAGGSIQNPLVQDPSGASNAIAGNPQGGTTIANPVLPGFQPNVNPGTQSGSGPFGSVAGTVGLPQPFNDLNSVFPGLGQDNAALSNNVLSELEGGVSPETSAATYGAQSTFGGSGFLNMSPMSLGLTDTSLQNQGLSEYAGLLPLIDTTQTVSPEVQAQIQQFNAEQAAAPDPSAQEGMQAGMAAIGLIAALA